MPKTDPVQNERKKKKNMQAGACPKIKKKKCTRIIVIFSRGEKRKEK